MPMTNKAFFDAVRRPLFSGRLTQAQVDGLNQIVQYGLDHGYTLWQIAYILATAHHETGRRMQPIREGFAKTDMGARLAVGRLLARGIISWNYAAPDENGNSFYGRGLVQITHKDNYAKFEEITGKPLSTDPDLALEWGVALVCLYVGHVRGLYTGKKLPRNGANFPPMLRAIINGDVRKNGKKVSRYADLYLNALNAMEAAHGN